MFIKTKLSISNVLRFACASLILGAFWVAPQVQASTVEISSSVQWESGTLNNVNIATQAGTLELKTDGTWGARSWRTPDLALSVGTALTTDGTDIYTTRGLGDVLFWKYDPDADNWSTLANLPAPGRYQPLYFHLRVSRDLCFW